MRKPLTPLQAFAEDARLAAERGSDVGDEMVVWLSVAQAVDRLAGAPAREQPAVISEARQLLAPFATRRPTMTHDAKPAPVDSLDILFEQFRVAAEAMELGGCFELAFTVVSAVCRLNASHGYVGAMLATTHLGRIARQMNDYSAAEDCYSNVIATGARERDGPLQARGHIGLALVYDMRGNMPATEAEYHRALAVAAPLGTCAIAAWQGLMSMAMVRGQLADALLYGWKIYDAAGDDIDARIGVLSDLSIVAMQAGIMAPAINGFKQALSMCTTPRQRLPVLSGALRAAARVGDVPMAVAYDDDLLLTIRRANQPYMAAMTLLNAAEGWLWLRELDRATARVATARELATRYRYAEYEFRADELDRQIAQERKTVSPSPVENFVPGEVDGGLAMHRGIRRLEALRA